MTDITATVTKHILAITHPFVPPINAGSDLRSDLNFNCLDHTTLAMALEEELQIDVTDDQMMNRATVGDVVALVAMENTGRTLDGVTMVQITARGVDDLELLA